MSTKEIMNICGEDLQIGLYYLISRNAFKIHENKYKGYFPGCHKYYWAKY